MEDDDYEDLLDRYGSTKRNSAGVNESRFNPHQSDMRGHETEEINSSGQQRINSCPNVSESPDEIRRDNRCTRSALDDN